MARVLLVNDDIAEISAVKRVLARAGHQPVLATNAQDALTSLAQVTPDLLVVGASCEGGDALRRLAGDEAARAIRLVVLGEPDDAPPGAATLSRPVDPGQLADQVTASLAAGPPRRPGARATAAKVAVPAAKAAAPAAKVATPAAKPAARPAARQAPTNGPPAHDPGAARRAAAEALRARAAELRRGTAPVLEAVPAPPPAPEEEPAEEPADAEKPAAAFSLDLEDSGLEAILRRAEEAERAHAAERKARARQADRAVVEAAQRAEAERAVVEKTSRVRVAEERIRTEERARAEAERKAAAEAAARRRAEEERQAVEEEHQVAQARIRTEERARTEAERKAATEGAARRRAEEEREAAEAQRQAAEEEHQVAEERARRETEEEARRAAEAEARAQAEEEARRAAETRAREEADARKRAEAARRAAEAEKRTAEAQRRAAEERGRRGTEEEARRAEEAQERARLEAIARKQLEEELEKLRGQVEAERRSAEERIQSVMERAAAEERAAEDLRRLSDEETQRRLEEEAQRRQAEEEQLRGAIASARAEMEALRKKGEEDARRRAEAEAEIARLARVAERRAAEAAAQPAPFDLPVYRPPQPDEEPEPDPSEEAARRRVAALRGESVPETPAPRRPAEPPAPAAPELEPPRPRPRPPPPELRGGTLADIPAPRLLAMAARAEVTGRLDLEGEIARSLWFEGGRVVGAASADPSERVEELALRLGLVTRDQHRQIASAAAALSTRRAALLLLERGFLKPTELTPVVRRRTEEVVFGAFADAAAAFRWAVEEVPPEERIALERDTLALAVEGVRRRWLAPQVDAVLGGPGTLLSPVTAGPTVQELSLSAEERRVVALADGLRTLDEIVAASPLDPLTTRQVLAALVLVGSLAVRVFQGGKPAAAATAAIDLVRVREKLDQVRRADYFTILGVSRLCTPHEVRQAAERLSAEFEPRRYQGIREDGLLARLDEILRVLADAREILVDDRLRSEYLRGLGDER